MSTKTHHFKLGLFVICTVLMLIAGIIVLSARLFVQDTLLLETYIDESVQGLSVGSPVMQRGVQIGSVKTITFVPGEYDMQYGSTEFFTYSKYVMVIMAIDRSTFPDILEPGDIRLITKQWIANGLRLKLSYQGITGIAYVEADYVDDPQRYEPMKITWKPRNLYIPSMPSIFRSFTQSIDGIFETLNGIDFEELAVTLDETLVSIKQLIADAQVAETREDLAGLMADLRETNKYVQGLMDESKGLDGGVNIPDAIAQFSRTLKRIEQFVTAQQSEVEDIMANLRIASGNLRNMTETLKRHPSQLLFGDAPEHPEVVK
ncbi:MAG: MCE family protein [Planctomycetes bacterium]|nr:MCE family protein [Planctomycetota bacterium]